MVLGKQAEPLSPTPHFGIHQTQACCVGCCGPGPVSARAASEASWAGWGLGAGGERVAQGEGNSGTCVPGAYLLEQVRLRRLLAVHRSDWGF